MRNLLGIFLSLVAFSAWAVEVCPTNNLGDFLDQENPRVITFIQSLDTAVDQSPLPGFRLCNGDVLFKGWRFIGLARGLRAGQHVYLFSHGKAYRAVAWVDRGANPLLIPTCPSHLDCRNQPEGQNDIAGEVYTYKYLEPDSGPIILLFPLRSWFPA